MQTPSGVNGNEIEKQRMFTVWQQLLKSTSSGSDFVETRLRVWDIIKGCVGPQLVENAGRLDFEWKKDPSKMRELGGPALHLLYLTDVVVSGLKQVDYIEHSMEELASKIESLHDHPKVQNGMCIYLLTRTDHCMVTYLTKAVQFIYEASSTIKLCESQAKRSVGAIWLLIRGVIVNQYALDARLLLAQNPGLTDCFLRLSSMPSFGISLLDVFDVFGPSIRWKKAVTNDHAVIDTLQHIARNHLTQPLTLENFVQDVQLLNVFFLLHGCSEEIALKISLDDDLADVVIELIYRLSTEYPLTVIAAYALVWQESNPPNCFLDMVKERFSGVTMLGGIMLIIMHNIGCTKVGADSLYAGGARILAILKRVDQIFKHSSALNPLIGGLMECIVTNTPTDSQMLAQLTPKRIKHYNQLIRCGCCALIADGSRNLKICGECHLTRYCGRTCQQEDWRDLHSRTCRHALDEKRASPVDARKTVPLLNGSHLRKSS